MKVSQSWSLVNKDGLYDAAMALLLPTVAFLAIPIGLYANNLDDFSPYVLRPFLLIGRNNDAGALV